MIPAVIAYIQFNSSIIQLIGINVCCFYFSDFPNDTKTETAEPIWLPTDLKEMADEIVDVKFEEPNSTVGPYKSSNEVQTRQVSAFISFSWFYDS